MAAAMFRVYGRLVTGVVASVVLVCGFWGEVAHAQTPGAELRAGYAFVRDADFDLPRGWYADIGVPLRGSINIVGEIGQSQTTGMELGLPVTFALTSFLGGVRVVDREGVVRPFVNALGGVARASGGVRLERLPGIGGLDLTVSSLAVVLQSGGGVTVHVSPRVGVSVGGDYRWGGSSAGELREFRFATGVVVLVGRR